MTLTGALQPSLDELPERHWTEQTSDGYRITTLGAFVTVEYLTFPDTLEQIDDFEQFIEELPSKTISPFHSISETDASKSRDERESLMIPLISTLISTPEVPGHHRFFDDYATRTGVIAVKIREFEFDGIAVVSRPLLSILPRRDFRHRRFR